MKKMFLSSKMLRRLFMQTSLLRDDMVGASWMLFHSAPHSWASCTKTCAFKIVHSQNEQLAHEITVFRKQFGTYNSSNQPKSERDRDVIFTDSNPDVFGTSKSKITSVVEEEEEGDEGDKLEEQHIQEHPRKRLFMKQYANIIKELLEQRKVAEAIDVLETKMLKEDRAKPSNYIYNILISECGRLGYTKKAFQLYNRMKERGLKVTGATYTALFNACANSPWTSDGLKRARHLRNLMIEKAHEPNSTNYHAMIKAFGRCGDLKTAFTLVDEMLERKHRLTDETYNFLFQSCISDKEAGFRHTLLVWRKMLKMHVAPNIYTYNLLLRSVRDCGLGDPVVSEDLFRTLDSENSQELLRGENDSSVPAISEQHMLQTQNVGKDIVNEDRMYSIQCRPNLLAPKPNFGNIISVREVTKPEERLMLIGGCSGFLQQMARDSVKPNVKTFTVLLEVIPPTLAAEKMLLSAMEKAGVKPDIDFYNILIKKRSMRCDYESAQEVLRMVQRQKLHPDIVTFGVLALGCRTQEEAYNLADDMKIAGFRMNVEILGAMVKQACFHWNFKYVMAVLDIMKEEEVKPSAIFMQHLENFHKRCLKAIKYKDNPLPKDMSRSALKKGFQTFSAYYDQWLKETEPEKINHPWEQFRKKKSVRS